MQTTFGKINLEKLKAGTQTLIIGDALKVLEEFPNNSVDLIISDEPYTDIEEHRKVGTTTRLSKSKGSDRDWYDTIKYEDIIPFYSWILKSGAHWYFWRPSLMESSLQNWCKLLEPKNGLCASNGFIIRKAIPIKKQKGMGYSWASSHEYIVFAYKDGNFKQLNDLALKDYMDDIIWPSPKTKIHDSQKPIMVTRRIIQNSSNEGDIVLEAFAGSFGSGEANYMYNLNRKVIGIEKNEEIANTTIKYFEKQGVPLNVINFTASEKLF